MPIVFRLLADGQVVTLPDPAGGQFDAAGDIDRLLPLPTELPLERGFNLEVLGRVEAFEDVYFTAADMVGIVSDTRALLVLARSGPETRGLDRLRTMAEEAQRLPGAVIKSLGD